MMGIRCYKWINLKLNEKWDFKVSKYFPTKILNYKGRNFTADKPGRYHLSQVIKANSISNGTKRNHESSHDWYDAIRKTENFVIFLSKMPKLTLIMRKPQTNTNGMPFYEIVAL